MLSRWVAPAAALALLAAFAAAAEPAGNPSGDAPRLLTGLTAEAGPDGVALAWTVDERRAGRIAGFSCAYRTPGHLELGVSGAVPCAPGGSPPEARGRTVAGLPEYGEYLFEVVAHAGPGPGIPWPARALHVRLEVTEELAGPPGAAVTGAGPLVAGCGPEDARPWRLDQVVSAAHLAHFPGRGWSAGGAAEVLPDWPEPPSLAEVVREAGAEPELVRRALAGRGAESRAAAEAVAGSLAGEGGRPPALARAAAGTKALLREAPGGAFELRLHSSYPFGGEYLFQSRHAVPGWSDPAHAAAWPRLRHRLQCPPPRQPDVTHDVALVVADRAGGGRRLAHAGYGWWTVAPVGMFPERIVAAKAGLSFGSPAAPAPAAGTRWRGRASGHLFWDRRRWALAADVTLELVTPGDAATLAGRIDDVRLAPLDPKRLEPAAAAPGGWRALTLEPGPAAGGAWAGALTLDGERSDGEPDGLPGARAFRGDWSAAAYGAHAEEVAGRLRLWTPLGAGADAAAGWPAQAVLVAGFGAAQAAGGRP